MPLASIGPVTPDSESARPVAVTRQTKCCLHPFPHTWLQCIKWQYPPFAPPIIRASR